MAEPKILSWVNGDKSLLYQPSKKESDIIGVIMDKFQTARGMRDEIYRNFNDRSLVEYVNDSMDRWNGYIEPRDDPAADWGARVFNNMTRNKVVSIVAQTTAERIKGEYFAQSKDDPEDKVAADIAKKFNDHASYINKDEEAQFYSTLECVIKGTVVGFETFKTEKRKVKEIKKYDASTGVVEFDEKEITDWNDVSSEIPPLLDIYVGNIYERNIQRQPFIVWRTVMKMSDAERDWGRFKNWNYVQAGGDLSYDDVFKNLISSDVLDDEVEVIRYFCRADDEMHIVANGVLLTNTISPFPWNHKKYPFWVARFEPFAIDFFYGRSLPDKLKPDQDIVNVLSRMMLDQQYLSI
ncbi:MAG: hypothetical protein KKF62_19405, partial [Bacteroidetes bacterium]|nr:hypothetical protein [Bacteroidota bacterium]